MTRQFIGTCVENPFGRIDTLCNIVEGAYEITKDVFLSHCYVDELTIEQMEEYPNSYKFYVFEGIYFFSNSAIEYFYN